MRNRARVDIAYTLRGIVGTIAEESIVERFESPRASYQHSAYAYVLIRTVNRRRTVHADNYDKF